MSNSNPIDRENNDLLLEEVEDSPDMELQARPHEGRGNPDLPESQMEEVSDEEEETGT